jgi:hypothetical protein
MRDAETTLAIIQDRGRRGLHLEDVYRRLFNSDLYLRAYGRIYRNAGALTEGVTAETADGMSLEKIGRLIDDIRHERHRWTPVRRVYIPKSNGKMRPLGVPICRSYCTSSQGGWGSRGPEPGPPSVRERSGPGSPGPMAPDRLPKLGDDLGRHSNPPRAVRHRLDAFEATRPTPGGDRSRCSRSIAPPPPGPCSARPRDTRPGTRPGRRGNRRGSNRHI